MVLRNTIFEKLQYFDDPDAEYLNDLLSNRNIGRLDDDGEYIFLKMWRSVDDTTADHKKHLLVEMMEKIYVQHSEPVFHVAFKGENVAVDILLDDDDDFTGSFLLARDEETKTALSDDTLLGSSAAKQTVKMIDLDLDANTFYKIFILLETDNGAGAASGNVEAVVNEIFLYLDEDVDSN